MKLKELEKVKMDWNSSMISSTIYESATETMEVTFTKGLTYRYSQISMKEYTEFCLAESQGKYFNSNFKNKKPFTKDDNEKN